MTTKTKETEQAVIAEIANVPVTVQAFGNTYEIKKFGLGQIARAMEFIGPIRIAIQHMNDLPKDKRGQPIASELDMANIALAALQFSGESCLGLISVATHEPVDFLEEQDPMEGLEILVAVIETNIPLFSQDNLKRGKEIFARLQSKIPALGGATSTP